jgi:FkbM family methyltransferase
MDAYPRKVAFVLAATDQGTYLVNRFDHHANATGEFGVGHKLLQAASWEPVEIRNATTLLSLRRDYFGPGVVGIDCGANIGLHTVSWARKMTGWGSVLALEAQEKIFYALCGNIALNNVFNARAMHAAVSSKVGRMDIPTLDYQSPASFGSLELKPASTEFIGQAIDYSSDAMTAIDTISLDSLNLSRVDLIKIDVEGMEMEVLEGAKEILSRFKPILIVEWIKTDRVKLERHLADYGYVTFAVGVNLIAAHRSDKTLTHMELPPAEGRPADKQ